MSATDHPGPSPARAAAPLRTLTAATGAAALAAVAARSGAPEAGVALAAAAAGLALFGVGAAWRRRSRAPAHLRAFRRLCGASDEPAALTDAAGRVEATNAALLSRLAQHQGDAAPPLVASDALAPFTGDPGPLAYRLLGAAARDGAACERARRGRAEWLIAARRASEGRLLWTATPAARVLGSGDRDDLIERLPVALARLSPEGRIQFVNAAARKLLGAAARDGATISDVMEGLGRSMETRIAEALRGDSSGRPEIARAQPDGREAFLQVSLTRLGAEEDGAGLVAVFVDATDLQTRESQFVQSQKMQAVGQLAGGVAHDFNNLLTAISGHTDLLLQRHAHGDSDYADLNQIRQNANRAAALVRQLLAFSRKQTLRPRVVRLTDTLTEISHLLNRLLGEKVTLRIDLAEDAHPVKVDERQFEQVIMNLVVNARDAMKETGGEVTLRSRNWRIEQETRRGRAVIPRGDYVRIDVADTGCGIPADTLEKIFEPFYTTKRQGEGTGLGLSTVYGIIKQTGGFIFAESEPGAGAVFSIYLPRSDEAPPETAAVAPTPEAQDNTGHGVVMLIEDEAPVRAFASRALKLRGYEVLEAASAEEALALLADETLHVDVLVSDVVMPGMDGPTCVREARKMRPDVRVVLVSGYAEDALKRSMDGIENCSFLPKPFSLNDLTARVKACMAS